MSSQLENEFMDATDKFRFRRLIPTCNHYAIFPDLTNYTNNAVPMTGADVTKAIRIPFPHRINKICFYHMTSAFAASTDPFSYSFAVKQGQHDFLAKLEDALVSVSGSTSSKIIEVFGTAYEYEARTWTLTMNTTNTDLIIPVIYVQLIGSGYI